MNIRITLSDGSISTVGAEIIHNDNGFCAVLRKENIPKGALQVDLLYDMFCAKVGDDGCFVVPGGSTEGVYLTYFKERTDAVHYADHTHMGVYGMIKDGKAIVGIAEGMRFDFNLYEEKRVTHIPFICDTSFAAMSLTRIFP